MSEHAIAYVHSRNLADETARRVFLAVAEQSRGEGDILGLNLWDTDIPVLAQRAGLGVEEFRRQLRALTQHVRTDVLEHSDGLWEIVYGPSSTQPPRPPSPRPSPPTYRAGRGHQVLADHPTTVTAPRRLVRCKAGAAKVARYSGSAAASALISGPRSPTRTTSDQQQLP
ncbi:hypothetical protein AB0F18_17780 [Streptomyces sp. NPDC029216]|uniref:hypothetical protein n=1 Tax=Streptomyces sp. NPDC029216 TaxID=3154701 RepID=UPI0033F802EB